MKHPAFWLAFIVSQGAVQAARGEKTRPPIVGLARQDVPPGAALG